MNSALLEEIYRPYKSSRKTKAEIAQEKKLDVFLDKLLRYKNREKGFFESALKTYQLESEQELQELLIALLSRRIQESEILMKTGFETLMGLRIVSKKKKNAQDEKGTYSTYYEFECSLKRLRPHQILALFRAQKEKVLSLDIPVPEKTLHYLMIQVKKELRIGRHIAWSEQVEEMLLKAIKTNLIPSWKRQLNNHLQDNATDHSLEVFAQNLNSILLTPGIKSSRILGMDPGFAHGCKCGLLSGDGELLDSTKFFLNRKEKLPHDSFASYLKKHQVDLIAIGNGVGSRETEQFVSQVLENAQIKTKFLVVNEAGASVYSASQLAGEELPDLDISFRGAVSIARRVLDPLNEYVKIPVESLGIGMYQHDLGSSRLKSRLEIELEQVVNEVGVDVNRASLPVLEKLSGVGPKLAKSIAQYRDKKTVSTRKELLQIQGMGEKTYEQCAGFCRVPGSNQEFDQTIIHPDQYELARKVLNTFQCSLDEFRSGDLKFEDLANRFSAESVSREDLASLYRCMKTATIDPRELRDQPPLRSGALKIEDLKRGTAMEGVVRNVVDFGLFIDIGVGQDGLLHRSQLAKGKQLHQYTVGQVLQLVVNNVDLKRNRIELSLA